MITSDNSDYRRWTNCRPGCTTVDLDSLRAVGGLMNKLQFLTKSAAASVSADRVAPAMR
jgi:hypothetical protein